MGQHYPTALSLFKKLLQVVFHRADAGDTEALHQHLGHIRTEKCRQRGAKMDLLYAKIQQGQQYDDRLLLIPGDIIDDRQVIDILQAEYFLELQRDDRQRVGIVALPRVQHPGDPPDVAQIQFVVFGTWRSPR